MESQQKIKVNTNDNREEHILIAHLRIRLNEFEEAIKNYQEAKTVRSKTDAVKTISTRGDDLLWALFLSREETTIKPRMRYEANKDVEKIFITHEELLKSLPLLKISGGLTAYQRLEMFVRQGVLLDSHGELLKEITNQKQEIEFLLNESDKFNRKNKKRPIKKAEKKSKKEVAFLSWVKEFDVDLNESLDRIDLQKDEAYLAGDIEYKIARSTLAEYLKKFRR